MLDLAKALDQIWERRRQEYIIHWLTMHRREYPDDSTALLHCRPTDDAIDWPPKEGAFAADWGTGHIVIDIAQAKNLLPANQLSKIYKLGGLE